MTVNHSQFGDCAASGPYN